MSSIAYVTDEKMLEYHRLCANKQMLFWRLTTNKKFTDFKKGDLLFFFSKTRFSKRKGLVGYAHFDSMMKLSINTMWKKYQNLTGYDTKHQLEETVIRASRAHILPKTISCLYLTDVVFFNTPVFPKDVNLNIPAKLESFQYLDKNDPEITVRILEKAEETGIDVWSSDPEIDSDLIFQNDETRQKVAMIHKQIGTNGLKQSELAKAKKLIQQKINDGWELVRDSELEIIKIEKKDLIIGIPFLCNSQTKDLRIQEYIGRVMLYKYGLRKLNVNKRISFEIISNESIDEIQNILAEGFE